MKKPYDVERRSFDPEILNFTLVSMQNAIETNAANTNAKIQDLKEDIHELKEENKKKNDEFKDVEVEFKICKASKGGEGKANTKRNALLLQIITIVIASGALLLGALGYFKKGGS